MLDYKMLEQIGKECGFTHVVPLKVDTIVLMQEVRDMCAKNSCGMYGKNWKCPPGVGTLEECGERIRAFENGILVQTVGELEDSMDVETMMETNENHLRYFDAMHKRLAESYPRMMAIGAGTCTRCKQCTYPDEPCRFPDFSFGSMEANGMLVTQVCQANDLPYYHGPDTIAYTSCFLLE